MDWVISDELQLTVGHVVGWASAGAIIVGGVIPYIPQYKQIKETQNTEGFSLFVCLALLIANILRILFWFGKKYELPLLVQSIVMNITMFAMIHLCVQVKNRNQLIQARARIGAARSNEVAMMLKSKPRRTSHSICDFEKKYFWAWTDFQSYLDCMLVFTIVAALFMYLLIDIALFVEIIGFLALFTESMLGTPQLIKNCQNKSTEGMSFVMVVLWTCGDVFKTTYFVVREAPLQFWICGSIQVTVDVLILCQVYIYKKSSGPPRPSGPHRID